LYFFRFVLEYTDIEALPATVTLLTGHDYCSMLRQSPLILPFREPALTSVLIRHAAASHGIGMWGRWKQTGSWNVLYFIFLLICSTLKEAPILTLWCLCGKKSKLGKIKIVRDAEREPIWDCSLVMWFSHIHQRVKIRAS